MRLSNGAWRVFVLALAAACGGENLVLPEEGVPAAIEVVEGESQTGTVGGPLTDSLAVRVLDGQSRPVPGQQVTFTPAAGSGSVAPTTRVTGADGIARTLWTLGTSAGAQTVEAKATGGAAPANLLVIFHATAVAASPATLTKISGDQQSATVGSTLSDSLIVRATDSQGNGVAGVTVSWAATGGGSVSDAQTVTGTDGRTGVRRTLGGTAGPQGTTATSPGLSGSPVSFTSTATVGAGGQLVIVQQPSATAASGQAFTVQPQVQVRDAFGNDVPGANRAIVAELASGPGGLVGSATAFTNAGGLAVFSTLGISGSAGTYTLNFSGPSLSGTLSNPIQITSGAATRLGLITPPPGSAASGAVLGTSPRVQLQDASGNAVSQSGITVNVSIGSGSASLSGTTSIATDGQGIATFNGLSLTGTAGAQVTLLFASSGLTSVSSPAITIGAGQVSSANSTLSVTASPITASSGSSSTSVVVTARDASGNVVAGAAVAVSVSGSGNTISGPGTTDASGVYTATVSSTQAATKTVTATINGSQITQQGTLTVNAAAPSTTQSTVAANPGTISAGGTGSTITVIVRDAFGNPVPGRTVTLAVNPPAGVGITQPAAVTSALGVATGTVSSTSVGSKTVTATISSVGAITQTATVTVNPGVPSAANSTVALTGSPIVASAGTNTATVSVTVRDGSGNVVPNVSVLLFATGAGHVFTPQNGLTNSSGVFTATVSSTQAGTKTISASAAGVDISQTQTLTVNAAPPSTGQSLVSALPTTIEATSGTSTITITVRDAFGNPVAGRSVTLAASPSGGVSFTQPAVQTNASGVTTGTMSSTSTGAKTVTATITGIGAITQTATVTVVTQSVSAANSTVAVAPATITASTGASTSTITVTVRDGAGAPIPGVTVSVFVGGSNTVTQPSGPTNASGVATATVSSTEAGVKTVSAVAGGVPITQTQQLTVAPAAVSAATSTVEAQTPRNTGQASAITVTVRDAFMNPIQGAAVVLGASPVGGAITQPGATTNASGVATGSFSSLVANSYTITATAAGTAITDNATVVVTP